MRIVLEKMAKIQTNWFYLVFFVICVKSNYAMLETNETDNIFFDFEQMKRDIFLKSDFNNLSLPDELRENLCFKELNDTRNGLMEYEQWAIKRK